MEKKQVSLEELNRAVAEFKEFLMQSVKETRDRDIEAIVGLVFQRTLEMFPPKQPSAYEDKPVTFSFDWEDKWFKRYPLLHAKARQRSRCQPPKFTEEELAERAGLAGVLLWHKELLDHWFERSGSLALSELSHTSLRALLFMLARCGDESAFLELLSRDTDFISHPFFSHSLKGWKVEAREGNELAKDVLKKVVAMITRSTLVDTGIKSRGGQIKSEANARICNQYWEMITETPEKKDTDIYKLIARRELKEKKQDQENKGLPVENVTGGRVAQRAEAIRKLIQRKNLHLYRQGRGPESWGYKYLKEKY